MNSGAFIFDMDGVLVDSNPYHKKALKLFAEKYGYSLSEEELIKKIYGRTNKEWIASLFGRTLTPDENARYAEEKEQLFRSLYQADIHAVQGLLTFLQAMKSLHIPCAIGTSAPRANVDFTLNAIGMREFFPIILDERDVTHGKPNPEIYIKCANALGYAPSRCVVFEDSLSGVAAGNAAGCHVVGICTTHSGEELGTRLFAPDFTTLSPKLVLDTFGLC